ncbi:MAG: MoaD/ThiS family protein [Candidatus Thorarchaeota archaeon]
MIEIHLYGSLKKLVEGSRLSEDTILMMEFVENETYSELILRMGLKLQDLGDCFINGTIAKKNQVLSDGDRVGLFPFNMVLLCGGHHINGHGITKGKFDVDYY